MFLLKLEVPVSFFGCVISFHEEPQLPLLLFVSPIAALQDMTGQYYQGTIATVTF